MSFLQKHDTGNAVADLRACLRSMTEARAGEPWRPGDFVHMRMAEVEAILAAIDAKDKALLKAAGQFSNYANQHRAKGTPESRTKAVVNEEFAISTLAAVDA
jgi:hypothetical protein